MDVLERLEQLEAQMREMRDIEEIRRLISTYAFNADLGRLDGYIAGWTDDGVYDVLETMQCTGKDELGRLLSDKEGVHKTLLEDRSQHAVVNLYIRVESNTAFAEGYSMVLYAHNGKFEVFTAGYNHWDFVRQDGRWLMKLRTRRVIGGPTSGRDVIKTYLD